MMYEEDRENRNNSEAGYNDRNDEHMEYRSNESRNTENQEVRREQHFAAESGQSSSETWRSAAGESSQGSAGNGAWQGSAQAVQKRGGQQPERRGPWAGASGPPGRQRAKQGRPATERPAGRPPGRIEGCAAPSRPGNRPASRERRPWAAGQRHRCSSSTSAHPGLQSCPP